MLKVQFVGDARRTVYVVFRKQASDSSFHNIARILGIVDETYRELLREPTVTIEGRACPLRLLFDWECDDVRGRCFFLRRLLQRFSLHVCLLCIS